MTARTTPRPIYHHKKRQHNIRLLDSGRRREVQVKRQVLTFNPSAPAVPVTFPKYQSFDPWDFRWAA
jgi:hypothetical protein